MDIIYRDNDIVVCVKPAGVLSTDEPGGLPELLREELSIDDVRTVHRLDRVVSGLMVLALNAESASALSAQIRAGELQKEYLAVVHGETPPRGTMKDLLLRDKTERKTYVVKKPDKGVQEAELEYETVWQGGGLSRVRILLHTGRTHQIRCQFSSRGFPLVGDKKYSLLDDGCNIALWSHMLAFRHPLTLQSLSFVKEPPDVPPWCTSC